MPADRDKKLEEIARKPEWRLEDVTALGIDGFIACGNHSDRYGEDSHVWDLACVECADRLKLIETVGPRLLSLGQQSGREEAAKTFAEILGVAQQMAKLAREKSFIIGMENFAEAAEYICDKAKAAAIRRGEE